jgi:hypothetical protein
LRRLSLPASNFSSGPTAFEPIRAWGSFGNNGRSQIHNNNNVSDFLQADTLKVVVGLNGCWQRAEAEDPSGRLIV